MAPQVDGQATNISIGWTDRTDGYFVWRHRIMQVDCTTCSVVVLDTDDGGGWMTTDSSSLITDALSAVRANYQNHFFPSQALKDSMKGRETKPCALYPFLYGVALSYSG
jgi:hypothetical protein